MINGVEIERVSEIKILGVKIDNKLSWKPHQSKKSQSQFQYFVKQTVFGINFIVNLVSIYNLLCKNISNKDKSNVHTSKDP